MDINSMSEISILNHQSRLMLCLNVHPNYFGKFNFYTSFLFSSHVNYRTESEKMQYTFI